MTPVNTAVVQDDDAGVESVHRLQLLDTPPQARFDRITSAASRLLSSSIALIAMADNPKIKVIAEGIEHEEQRELLMNMGCRYGQGFLLGSAQTACRFKLTRYGNLSFGNRQNRNAA